MERNYKNSFQIRHGQYENIIFLMNIFSWKYFQVFSSKNYYLGGSFATLSPSVQKRTFLPLLIWTSNIFVDSIWKKGWVVCFESCWVSSKKIASQKIDSVLLIKQIYEKFWLNIFKNCLYIFEKNNNLNIAWIYIWCNISEVSPYFI